MADILALVHLRAGYGAATVIEDLSLALPEGKSLAVLGRNGAGKTTLLNSIIGATQRFGGTLALAGQDITRMTSDQRALAGIGWVPQSAIFSVRSRWKRTCWPSRGRALDAPAGLCHVPAAGRAQAQSGQSALWR